MNGSAGFAEAIGILMAIGAAFSGRAMAMAMQRPMLGWLLLWELPVVVGMGIIGAGAADWLDWHGSRAGALIAVMGYLGPGSILPLIKILLRRTTTP